MSNKNIIVESISTPEEPGYRDNVVVANKHVLYDGPGSACPNPYRPIRPWRLKPIPWDDSEKGYGWIGLVSVPYRTVWNVRRGLHLVLNEGAHVRARRPNPVHDGGWFLTQLLAHKGWTETWRGSAGCITVPPSQWSRFIDCFMVGDTGTLTVLDYEKLKHPARGCCRALHCPLFRGIT